MQTIEVQAIDWTAATAGSLGRQIEAAMKAIDYDHWHYIEYAQNPKLKVSKGSIYTSMAPGDKCWHIKVQAGNETVLKLSLSYSLMMVSKVNAVVTGIVFGRQKELEILLRASNV